MLGELKLIVGTGPDLSGMVSSQPNPEHLITDRVARPFIEMDHADANGSSSSLRNPLAIGQSRPLRRAEAMPNTECLCLPSPFRPSGTRVLGRICAQVPRYAYSAAAVFFSSSVATRPGRSPRAVWDAL